MSVSPWCKVSNVELFNNKNNIEKKGAAKDRNFLIHNLSLRIVDGIKKNHRKQGAEDVYPWMTS